MNIYKRRIKIENGVMVTLMVDQHNPMAMDVHVE